ncbi:MAG: hypothetical protein PUP90_17785 [Nostoc sp. S4]|nr:hypothetical protein [Nostoc sp. S4]
MRVRFSRRGFLKKAAFGAAVSSENLLRGEKVEANSDGLYSRQIFNYQSLILHNNQVRYNQIR